MGPHEFCVVFQFNLKLSEVFPSFLTLFACNQSPKTNTPLYRVTSSPSNIPTKTNTQHTTSYTFSKLSGLRPKKSV